MLTHSDTYYRQMDINNTANYYNKCVLRGLFLIIPLIFTPVLIINKDISKYNCGSLYIMLWAWNVSFVICMAMTLENISCNAIKVFIGCYSTFFISWGAINSKYILKETPCEQLIYKNYEALSTLIFFYYMAMSLLLIGNMIMFIFCICNNKKRQHTIGY